MSEGSYDHSHLFNLFWIACLDDVYDIEAAEDGIAILPSHPRAVALNLFGNLLCQFKEMFRIIEGLG